MKNAESDKFKSSLSKAMALCSKREYCTSDIHEKLVNWHLDPNEIDKIINILLSENFLNETRFTEAFTRDKFNYNKWGKVKIAAHLRAKKIPSEIIDTSLSVIDNELYVSTLKELLIQQRKRITAKNQYDLKGKLLRFGLSRGFESSLLYDIINEFLPGK